MNSFPLVSIIVPTYNHEKFLVQRLQSIFNQTFQDFEIILLDDCSTDESQLILKKYCLHPKVSNIVFNKINSGSPFKQWQKGINLAKGKYIWIAESDDFCENNFLHKLLEPLIVDSSLGIAYCQSDDVDVNGESLRSRVHYTEQFSPNIWKESFVIEGKKFVELYLSFFNVIPNASAVIFKKELISKPSCLNSFLEMKMCGDWFFWIKMALNSKVFFLNETLNYFREHQSSSRNHNDISKKKQRLLEEREGRSLMQTIEIFNLQSEQIMYCRWFDLHNYKNIIRKSFYKIKLDKTSYFSFLWFYFALKYKKKFQIFKIWLAN